MKVKVYPYRENSNTGNIIWPGHYPMRHGKFPADHPVGGGFSDVAECQCGNGANIEAFRSRGYWASCFPEGDGITWKPLNGQDKEQCIKDIRECFEWEAFWGA